MTTNEIKTGDYVRSFDFADGYQGRALTGERACYVEGYVEAIGDHPDPYTGYTVYMIRVERRVFGGRTMPINEPEWVYPPINGTPTLMGRTTSGVERLNG